MGDMNFYIEQPRTQEAQKNVCASYLVEMMKEKQKWAGSCSIMELQQPVTALFIPSLQQS